VTTCTRTLRARWSGDGKALRADRGGWIDPPFYWLICSTSLAAAIK
jgi:hypothetical protein